MKDFFKEHIIIYLALFYFLLAFPSIELVVLVNFGWLDSYVSHGDLALAWLAEYCLMMAVIKDSIENS